MDEAAARAYIARERTVGRRDAAVAHVRDEYLRSRNPGLWTALREVCTGPELDGVAPPARPVARDPDAALPKEPYAKFLGEAAAAPFRSATSIFMLVLSGPITMATSIQFGLGGFIGAVFGAIFYGFLCGYLLEIVLGASRGEPRPPGIRSLFDEGVLAFIGHFIGWCAATAVSFLPLSVFLGAYLTDRHAALLPFVALTAIAGFVWYPVALFQVTSRSWYSAINVPYGWGCIRRFGREYWRCAAFFVVTGAAGVAAHTGLSALIERGTGARLIANVFAGWLSYAPAMMQARALGLLWYTRA